MTSENYFRGIFSTCAHALFFVGILSLFTSFEGVPPPAGISRNEPTIASLVHYSAKPVLAPRISGEVKELLFEVVTNTQAANTQTKKFTVNNTGDAPLNITNINLTGAFASQFDVTPNSTKTIAAGGSLTFSVTYIPELDNNDLGYQAASLEISSNAADSPELNIGLYALKKRGLEGSFEPALADVVKTLGIDIDVGLTGLNNPTSADLVGEEVDVQTWEKVPGATTINITPVARYSPAEELPFGWYTNMNGQVDRNRTGVLKEGLLNAQRLYPPLKSGTTNFDPGNGEFGLYLFSNTFNRNNYSQDALNTDGVAHRARTYPVKDRQGNIVPNSYLVTFEDATNGDYQDYMFVIDNVQPTDATDQVIRVNFAKTKSGAPDGYFNDIGEAYGSKPNGYSYGWRNAATGEPANLNPNARNRNINGVSALQNTLIHMQYGSISNSSSYYLPDAKWEIEIPNGTYQVTLGVGDPQVDGETSSIPSHNINVEDNTFIKGFVPSGTEGAPSRFKKATTLVGVNDGKLTINALGGFNTKIDYIEVQPTAKELPFFTNVTPANYAKDVTITGFQINVELRVPDNYELDKNTTAGNVQLFEITDGGEEVLLPSNANDTGGGDAITLTPSNKLKPFTKYIFRVRDIEANRIGNLNDRLPFVNFESAFITGAEGNNPIPSRDLTGVEFTKVLGGEGLGDGTVNKLFSSLTIGPDGKLYASTLGDFQSDGKIQRWDILPDGTLTNLEVLSPELTGAPDPETGPRDNNNRLIIGLTFDPASTADNLIAYVTHSTASVTAGPAWDGKITRLSGPNLTNVQDLVIHLPRSLKDHLTNSMVFDDQGVMYISQGSNSAGGSPDAAWGFRKERLLSGAILKLDLSKLPSSLPLDVYTTSDIGVINNAPNNSIKMSDGTYNPYATNSPLTIFATGTRNAYDLLWHSNGWLYMPTNGTAGNNSNSPVTPTTDDYELARRIDGRTNIPSVPQIFGGETQKDWLFKTKGGTYHGHPNPYRGEFVLNHGGESYSNLPGQGEPHVDVKKYPTSVVPDPNYMKPAYDFGFNKSPDGVIEYKSNAFGGKLKGLLMVVRFSGQDDLLAMDPKDNGDISEVYPDIPGLSGFDDPLDVVEDTKNGNMYISEYDRDENGTPRLTLLRAKQPAEKGSLIASNKEELLFETVINDQGDQTQTKQVTVTNDGTAPLNINNVSIEGNFANQFENISPAGPQIIPAGGELVYSVTYAPDLNTNDFGYQDATLVFENNSPTEPEYEIGLFGLKKNGFEGESEPTLQSIVNTLGIGINVGWTTLTTDTSKTLKGEETDFQQWLQATDAPVTITPVGRYSPAEELPFGWYLNNGQVTRNEVGVLDNGIANAQRLNPPLKSGTNSFDPDGELFGIYVNSKFFDRYSYTQDALNSGEVSHRVRSYAIKDRQGNPVDNSYLITFEDSTNGDYQDYMFVISNVLPFNKGDFALSFDKEKINFDIVKNNGEQPAAQQITLSTNGSVSPDNVKLEAQQPWILIPQNVELDTPLDITIDASALSPGTYAGTITASAKGYSSAAVQINLTVESDLDYYYQFNFQDMDDKEISPKGYVDDFGTSYGIKTTALGDLNYGWVKPGTLTPAGAEQNGRNRNTPGDRNVLLRTFNLIGHREPDLYPLRDWVLNVHNGSYYVNISVGGDPEFSDSNHVLDVNGTNVISFNAQSDTEDRINVQDTKLVTVTDGLIRLSLGEGGVNAKINYIRIAPENKAEEPPILTADFDGFSNEPNSYRGSVKITLSAEAAIAEAEISSLTYSMDGAAAVNYTEPFTVNAVGDHVLNVTAEDTNGAKITNNYEFTVTQASGAQIVVENMTKIPGTDRGFPAEDYFTFSRLGKYRYSGTKTHDTNVMRINNTGTSNLIISSITVSDTASYRYEILDPDNTGGTLPLSIAPGSYKDLKLVFTGATTNGKSQLFKETMSIESNADNNSLATATLHGAFSPQPEQDGNGISDEISAQDVFDAFGFKTSMRSIVNDQGTITPPNSKPTHPSSFFPNTRNIDAGYEGDMILPKAFVQADPSAPIHIIQMSGLHGYTTANARFIQINGTGTVGGVSATQSKDYYQSLLPKNNSGQLNSDSADRITEPFRIAIESYLNTGGNNLNGRDPNVLGLRVYKVVDKNGKVVPNEYIALQDYVQNGCGAGSANCDWNDDTFYFTNIRPQAVPTSTDIAPYFAEVGTAFTYDVTYAFDKGYPGNKLTYSALMRDGSPIPSWLAFDPATGTFAGNPPSGSENIYNMNVTATDLNGLTTTATADITVAEAGSLQDIALRINAGGPTVDYDGNEFVADTFFKNGKSFTNNQAAVPTLFKTERSDALNFGYNVPVPNGLYTVTLHFAEIYWGANGGGAGGTQKRIFDVNLEDDLILDDYDITKDVGAQNPVAKTYIIDVKDGVINLNLSADPEVGGVDFPMLSALEVFGGKPVNKAPVAVASADPSQGYAPLPVSFTGSESSDDEGVVSYNWSLNGENLSTDADFDYNFKEPGTYEVTLTVADREGLETTDTATINVQDPGRPEDFAIRINAGGPTLNFDGKEFVADNYFIGGKAFVNTKATVPDLYQTERSASPPAFRYEIPVPDGKYTIVLHFAEIYFGANGGGTGGNGKRIFDVSVENTLALDNYDISADVGAQTPVTKSVVVDVSDQVLNIDLSALGNVGGKDQPKISAIEILGMAAPNEAPKAVATADVQEGTAPLNVNFVGGQSTDDKEIVSYEWKIDGESVSQNVNFSNEFTQKGSYAVTLKVSDEKGLSDMDTLNIKVNAANAAPVAVAVSNVSQGSAPLDISFTGDQSYDDVGVDTYSWKIGGDEVSTAPNFDYTFNDVGDYKVVLTVADADGLTGTDTLSIKIKAPNTAPVAVAVSNLAQGSSPLSVSFKGDQSYDDIGIETYSWKIGEDEVSTEQNFDYTFINDGDYTVALTVTDAGGLTATDAVTIKVGTAGSAPVAIAASDVAKGPSPLTVSFKGDQSYDDIGIETYSWKIGGDEVSTEQNFDYTFINDGDYKVVLTVADIDGLTATDTLNIKVNAPNTAPVAVAASDVAKGPSPLAVSFTGGQSYDDVGIEDYSWKIGGDEVSTEQNFDYTFINDGDYKVVLTVADIDGLTATDTLNIKVGRTGTAPVAIAKADFKVGGSAPLEISFKGDESYSEVDIVNYSWTIDTIQISDQQNFDDIFEEPGTYTVILTITDANGMTGTDTLDITVNNGEEGDPVAIIYPNPASTKVMVKIENALRKVTRVALIDSRGRIIQYFKPVSEKGVKIFEMNLPILASGFYLLRIEDDKGEIYQERLIIRTDRE